ncbi:MAG: ketoacyl-ACP synthase III [Chloroflexota bacterium]|nr:ketoacyl-ACP synthase III [Chloroflexota bacterium]
MPRHAAVTGWGHYAPEKVLTNRDLEGMLDTSDEWIRTRTGICERRIAAHDETTSTMCAIAAQRALDKAHMAAIDLDLIICATTTPDTLMPATACLVQDSIGAANAGAFDLNTACTGFVYGLVMASQFIQSGAYDRVLVVGGETLSRFLNWQDRTTCILFGDGAGAVVLEATEDESGLLSFVLGSQGSGGPLLTIAGGGAAKPASPETVAAGDHYLYMRGNEIFKFAVRSMVQAAGEALTKAGLTQEDVRVVVPHQANVRILRATQEALGLPWESVFVNVDRYGNTSAASVGIALSECADLGMLRPGDNLLFIAFGGGLTWASAVMRWADVDAIVAAREESPNVI